MNSHSLERTIKQRVLEAFGIAIMDVTFFELTLNVIDLNIIELNIIELNIIDVRKLDLAMCVSPSSNGSKMRSLWTNQMKS